MNVTLVWFALSFPAGTLVEYVLHRSLHGCLRKSFLGRYHADHHREGRAKPLWYELLAYQAVAVPFVMVAALVGPGCFWGVLGGSVSYAALVGLCHWRQHERCDPFHATHHARPRSNYGVLTSFWDRRLGTTNDAMPR